MLAIAILAAGKGTRMQSALPKVLQELSGITLIERVINSCKDIQADRYIIVIGHEAKRVRDSLKNIEGLEFVHQSPQKGTGHAVQQLIPMLGDFNGDLLVLNGDVPLLRQNTLKDLIRNHQSSNSSVSLLSARLSNPQGYGRVFTTKDNFVQKIIEDADCSDAERENNLINSGIYCFRWNDLKNVLNNLSYKNSQKELYLTDSIKILPKAIHVELEDTNEISGINDKLQLAACESIHQERLRNILMKNGVKFINPESSTVSDKCKIGKDVTIEPNTHIRGKTVIGDNSHLGPNSFIEDSIIGRNVTVFYSVLKQSHIGDDVDIGPYSHIRPETNIKNNCKIGNFVELKKSNLNEKAKVNHLSYIGDSDIGDSVNIAAGTITANYDGTQKHRTIVGANSKTGANTVLVAPLVIGEGVTIGAGSTITKDVPENSLAIGRAKQFIKANWLKKSHESQ
ncbi:MULTISPECIES: bifunctional UDP-N-acetylglucosamine diphosphorylase/glucosamine-1-phosphate N-acetyltransferase GlmU [unclassified Prochlorococcus]|uniref:bifunctional UDP-N-acetylglucosamine diphosphorylase/glucosamine-1-phosphate N-acetyltransferase GlmU n=1 Tax=unclassified Prochlorococcus TaxID=2627481 RepID=UPI000533748B|nr:MULTISPECIES: bifunctional UDP-N-acetylglucosamine diphosphorylase/glucosamine-1-phosphate N-acetyltransferase GlmU [unclassified Prochlorococcus]KGG15375.1 N-acetylglucosamine-1-phosphate uridyltransferase [Prochlorococcus sp. MIT 0602]KGG17653.1 N-acetylglucosamine-1-phosphate uridyltransferase [Prochlorococcus sp. MIT 0603]